MRLRYFRVFLPSEACVISGEPFFKSKVVMPIPNMTQVTMVEYMTFANTEHHRCLLNSRFRIDRRDRSLSEHGTGSQAMAAIAMAQMWSYGNGGGDQLRLWTPGVKLAERCH